ncbi:MAG: ferric reductase-like transmembrane domain-containing protein, partial [Candidatus Anstonellales archaeon]
VLGIGLFIIIMILASSILIENNLQRTKFLISSFGMISLLGLIFVLIIPVLYSKFPSTLTSSLLSNRKWIGLNVFVFALIHVMLVQLNYFNFNISAILNNPRFPGLFAGMIAFTSLMILAITSYDGIIRRLGKIWKPIHRVLSYLAAAVLIVHLWINGGFWAGNMLVKILITAVIIGIISYKILNLNINIKKQDE